MGAKAASILICKGNQDVRITVNIGNGLGGSPVCIEFAVVCMFSGIARYRGHMWEIGVSADGGHHRIDDKVPALSEKVQDDDVSWSGCVRRS